MSKFICVQNISSGLKEYRALLFKKGKQYDIELGRFVHYAVAEDGRRLPLTPEAFEGNFMALEDFQNLKEVEYIINEVGELMDDLEHNRISPKEFKELFVTTKGQQICHALIMSRKYIKG